jgi:uncharacterized membrane protein YebE (DUF533 family)
MMDPERLLGQLIAGRLGGKSKKRKSSGWLSGGTKTQIGLGAIGIAMAAFEHFKQSQQAGAAPPAAGHRSTSPPAARLGTPPVPPPLPTAPPTAPRLPGRDDPMDHADQLRHETTAGTDGPAIWLIRAMIAAAAADGQIDATESDKILSEAANNGLADEEREFLMQELARPRTISEIATAGTSPDMKRQLYFASLLAVDVDTAAEQQYLHDLATRLGLTDQDVAAIHAQVEA